MHNFSQDTAVLLKYKSPVSQSASALSNLSGLGLNETTVNIKTDNVHFKYK